MGKLSRRRRLRAMDEFIFHTGKVFFYLLGFLGYLLGFLVNFYSQHRRREREREHVNFF